jgi:hypothetical protein
MLVKLKAFKKVLLICDIRFTPNVPLGGYLLFNKAFQFPPGQELIPFEKAVHAYQGHTAKSGASAMRHFGYVLSVQPLTTIRQNMKPCLTNLVPLIPRCELDSIPMCDRRRTENLQINEGRFCTKAFNPPYSSQGFVWFAWEMRKRTIIEWPGDLPLHLCCQIEYNPAIKYEIDL